MADGSAKPPSFREQLARQLQFLGRSAELCDHGHLDEAVRIATSIRVILHDTPRSTSLLVHLSVPDLRLLTTCRGIPHDFLSGVPSKGTLALRYDGVGLFHQGPEGSYYRPKLGDGSFAGVLPASQWLDQVIMALDPSAMFTRRSIVLGAANRDGGTHVDRRLDPQYERLAYTEAFGFLVGRSESGEIRVPLYGQHFVALRQMAYELLHSPELLGLADPRSDA